MFSKALTLSPDRPEARLALAQALLASHQAEAALAHFQILAQNPVAAAEVHFGLALSLEQLDLSEAANLTLESQLPKQPQNAPAWLTLARRQVLNGQHGFAIKNFKQYLQLQPTDTSVVFELAEALDQAGETLEAASLFRHLYRQQPEQTHLLLRWAQLEAKEHPETMLQLLLQESIHIPANLRSYAAIQMAWVMEHASELEKRQACFEIAFADPHLAEKAGWELWAQLTLPYFPLNSSEIEKALAQLEAQLSHYEQALPLGAGIQSDFSNLQAYLRSWTCFSVMVYLNVDPLPWRLRWGKLFRQLLPPRPAPAPRKGELRIGFVLNQNRAVSAFLIELLRRWPADHGQIVLLFNSMPAGLPNPKIPILRADFEQILLSTEAASAIETIEACKLDLLFLSEIHTDQLLQSLLACYRLAPVQVTSWLSAGTSGLPDIDYFISTKLIEQSQNPQRFYSETLILMDELPTYLQLPVLLGQPPERGDYGLPAGHLYICPHLIYKLHPDYEAILAEILEQDPDGQLVLLQNPSNRFLRNRLLGRLESHYPHLMPRIWLLPRLTSQEYLGLLTVGDVMLDPFYLGGGTTSYEALGLGVPIVTWPGERLHGRATCSYYRKLNVLDCIASSPQDYVRLAIELGTRPEFNTHVRNRIKANLDRLFENEQAVQELADCVFELARQSRTD